MGEPSFKAIYGTFDKNMMPVLVDNVTEIIKRKFLKNGVVIIPVGTKLNHYFGDPVVGQRKFLCLDLGKSKHHIIEDNYTSDLRFDLNNPNKQIKLIYYLYMNRRSNWKKIISGQLLQLKSYGLLDEAEVYVHITDPENIFDDVISTVHDLCKEAKISKSTKNEYEYPGIKLVYDLATQDPGSVYIYLHAKGISRNVQSRIMEDLVVLPGTFENWRRKLEAFANKKINKMGLFPAVEGAQNKIDRGVRGGWIWFNFWYAKGSYLTSCEEPGLSANRFYYEDWLGGPQNENSVKKGDCQSLHYGSDKKYFTASQVYQELPALAKKIN